MRTEQKAVGNQIISNAKKHGLYIEPSAVKEKGVRLNKRTGESEVYINEEEGKAYKVKDPYAKIPIKGHSTADVLDEIELHNLLFPNTKYTLEGVTEGIDGVRLVLLWIYTMNSPLMLRLPIQTLGRGWSMGELSIQN